MKIGALISELQKYPQDMEIYIGYGFSWSSDESSIRTKVTDLLSLTDNRVNDSPCVVLLPVVE